MAFRKGSKHSEETKARIGAASGWRHARRRRLLEVAPRHIKMLEEGDVPARLRPLADESMALNADLVAAKGGHDVVTPQVRVLCGRAASLGLLADALALSFLQGGGTDPDLATRAGSLYTQQARVIGMLGLERHQRDVPDLRQHLAAVAARKPPSDAIDVEVVAQEPLDADAARTEPTGSDSAPATGALEGPTAKETDEEASEHG